MKLSGNASVDNGYLLTLTCTSLFSIDVTGQRVRTSFGEGTIVSYMEGNPSMGCRYRVKLPFGVASVRPSAILHSAIQPDGSIMARKDGIMTRDDSHASAGEATSPEKLDKKFQVMFATESVYIFMRMYCILVSVLTDTREHTKVFPPGPDPSDEWYVPTPMKEEGSSGPKPPADFPGVVSMLEKVVCRKVDLKDFETYCRRVSKEKVYQMAVLPKLVDKCTDALLNVAKEEMLLRIFDYCLPRQLVSNLNYVHVYSCFFWLSSSYCFNSNFPFAMNL